MRHGRLFSSMRRVTGLVVLAAMALVGWLVPASARAAGTNVQPTSVTADLGHNPVQMWR